MLRAAVMDHFGEEEPSFLRPLFKIQRKTAFEEEENIRRGKAKTRIFQTHLSLSAQSQTKTAPEWIPVKS